MPSALMRSVRSYAACHMTTAHQRHPNLVPLVLQVRSTQTTTHLVDIIQTVSRILLKAYDFALYGLYLHPASLREIGVLALCLITKLQHFCAKSLRGQIVIQISLILYLFLEIIRITYLEILDTLF